MKPRKLEDEDISEELTRDAPAAPQIPMPITPELLDAQSGLPNPASALRVLVGWFAVAFGGVREDTIADIADALAQRGIVATVREIALAATSEDAMAAAARFRSLLADSDMFMPALARDEFRAYIYSDAANRVFKTVGTYRELNLLNALKGAVFDLGGRHMNRRYLPETRTLADGADFPEIDTGPLIDSRLSSGYNSSDETGDTEESTK